MEKNGLLIKMGVCVADFAVGRRMLYNKGTEAEGLALYQRGYKKIMELFQEVLISRDPELMMLADYFYTARELFESSGNEPVAKKSAQSAVRQFEEALDVLQIVRDPAYCRITQKAFSSLPKYRYKGMPKDAFHVACLANKTRIRNLLTRIGLSEEDKDIAYARIAMINASQDAYAEMQGVSHL